MDLKKVCRSCLQPSESMMSIYSSIEVPSLEIPKLPILELLKIFKVSPGGDLQENICGDCLDKLQKAYTVFLKLKFENPESIFKPLKDDGESLDELINSTNKYQPYTETIIKVIKTEKTEYYDTLNEDQSEQTGSPEVFIVQEIKQESEIDISLEEGNFNETDSDGESLKNDLQCSVCMKNFKNNYNLKVHMRIHTGERPFKCEICTKRFRYKHILMLHMQSIHSAGTAINTKYKCALCSKSLSSKSYLNEHLKNHTGEKRFHCEVCPKKYRSKTSLAAHMRTVHADETTITKYKCATCSLLFGRVYELNRHMLVHTGARPYQCEVCPKKFGSKHNLVVHMQTLHSDGTMNNKKFKCSTCFHLFTRRCALDRHMIVHTDERPFPCEICPKKFRFPHNLKSHMQAVHSKRTTNSKQFKCTICSKLLSSKSYLNYHLRIHTGEKPFHCENCSKKFRSRNNLAAHVRTVHADKAKNNKNSKCTTSFTLLGDIDDSNHHLIEHTEEQSFDKTKEL